MPEANAFTLSWTGYAAAEEGKLLWAESAGNIFAQIEQGSGEQEREETTEREAYAT
jgi:hypothetical protein